MKVASFIVICPYENVQDVQERGSDAVRACHPLILSKSSNSGNAGGYSRRHRPLPYLHHQNIEAEGSILICMMRVIS
jgi:hypothetical protein